MKKFLFSILLAVILALVACEPTVPTTPVVTTSTQTTVAPTTSLAPPTTSSSCTAVTGAGDQTRALQSLIDRCTSVLIDSRLQVDGQIKVQSGKTVTWGPNGVIFSEKNPGPITQYFIYVTGTGITLNSPRIEGPNHRQSFPTGDPLCGYYTAYEHQHGIGIHNGHNVTINGGSIKEVFGDGIYIIDNSSDITINDINVNCVGRTAVTNLGSDNVRINGGTFADTIWWIFNIELQSQNVSNYYIDRPTVGYSRLEFLLASCPYAGRYSNITVNKPIFLPKAFPSYVARCGTIQVIR